MSDSALTGRPLDDPIVDAFQKHPALSITAVAGVVVVARLLVVSGYDVEVALAVLASAGPANVTVGTMVSAIPYAVLFGALLALDIAGMYYRTDRRALLTMYAGILLLGVAVLVSPAIYFAAFAVVAGITWLVRRRRTGPGTGKRGEPPLVYAFLVFGIPVVAFLQFNPTPWLPAERLTVDGDVVVGYVTSVDGPWTYVLRDEPRRVEALSSETVSERTDCSLRTDWYSITLSDLVRQRPGTLPPCRP